MFLPLVPGQELAKEYFRRAIQQDRLSHAYLFLGPEGAGKRLFARELSKAFFCSRGVACGECKACLSIEHGNHPSVDIYGPAEGKYLIDIDTIRALCSRTHYKSNQIQIAVLERAELLNEPAANALLKTLEEPPLNWILILTAQSAASLLPTIVSRCHRVLFTGTKISESVSPSEMEELLEEVSLPGFFGRQDSRQWLERLAPGEIEGTKNRLRHLLDLLVETRRAKLPASSAGKLEGLLRRLELYLDLRQDIERNINPELILEKLLQDLRRGT